MVGWITAAGVMTDSRYLGRGIEVNIRDSAKDICAHKGPPTCLSTYLSLLSTVETAGMLWNAHIHSRYAGQLLRSKDCDPNGAESKMEVNC